MSWERVRGHDEWVMGFTRAVNRGRLAHAYLFVGPGGVGKRLFAGELAKALLCEAPKPFGMLSACDVCPSCVLFEADTHPDFLTAVRPAESHEFPIELMRTVCQSFSLKSARGRGKVVVVDDADDLNEESASCFLKTLEEPPVGSVLILIGSSPDRQLATIVSRCQVIRFAPLPTELVEDLLAKNGIQDAWRSRLADLSGGSPGVALSLADPELWAFRRRLIDGLAERPIDAIGLGRAWAEFVEAAGKESAPQRGRARLALRLLVEFLDDALVVGQGGQPRRTTSDDAAALEKIAARLNPDLIIDLLERCLQADGHIERRVQLSLALESLLDALGQKLSAV